MDKAAGVPASHSFPTRRPRMGPLIAVFLVASVAVYSQLRFYTLFGSSVSADNHGEPPFHAAETVARCRALQMTPGPASDFHERKESDRFVPGTPPILLRNARIWTGDDEGKEVIKGDVLLDGGIIQGVGHFGHLPAHYSTDLKVINVEGAWVTPGIVDLHSHLGVDSSPELEGSDDTNSVQNTILPQMRSLDGLNTRDAAYPLSISGGVTTALVLPGSANAIGGQAFVIKLRKTAERSPTSMLLEPPYQINGTTHAYDKPPRWRHMKHACGENPSRVYGVTRMDTMWAFRNAYDKATIIKNKQDAYCAKVLTNNWKDLGDFPEDLQWEALVDVVRGRVKVNTHCYETVDLDDLVRLSNEFKFPIAAFHHAHETYLVPEVLKRAYGGPPAVAIFATNARYKREAYRGSEFAAKILADNNLTVIMKSDHPVLDSRHLVYEAQQAYYYGLPANLAIASVTSSSAKAMGMDHRIGFVKKGWDADLVVWDSHPLALGATPKQVFIDGIAQFNEPAITEKPEEFQKLPKVPNWEKEINETLKWDGLPPLTPKKAEEETVVFTNVKSFFSRDGGRVVEAANKFKGSESGVAVTRKGKVVCFGAMGECQQFVDELPTPMFVDLEGGCIAPGLLTFGSPLALEHISAEPSTNDGYIFDPLVGPIPKILGKETMVVRAIDGLQFSSRSALLAYRSGVTTGVTAPIPGYRGFYGGLGTSFSTGAAHKLEKGAVLKQETAVHMHVHPVGTPSVSTQIAVLRKLLLAPHDGWEDSWYSRVVEGEIPLVVEAHSADIIATLVLLKKEVDYQKGSTIRLTITGATEAHLLAKELGEAGIGVIVNPSRPFPYKWESRRVLEGPPLTTNTTISTLVENGVMVGIGTLEDWNARNARFDVAWAAIESNGKISKEQALAIGSTNLEKLLGAEVEDGQADFVAYRGGDVFELSSKVAAVLSPRRAVVDLL